MTVRKWILLLVICCLPAFAQAEGASDSLYVKKVENLPEDFIFGMDVSSVLAEEASGVKYYGFDGNETDLFRLLADNRGTASAEATVISGPPWRSGSVPPPAAWGFWWISTIPISGRIPASRWSRAPGKA